MLEKYRTFLEEFKNGLLQKKQEVSKIFEKQKTVPNNFEKQCLRKTSKKRL